eukprot:1271148-Amphidinium_carterae.2
MEEHNRRANQTNQQAHPTSYLKGRGRHTTWVKLLLGEAAFGAPLPRSISSVPTPPEVSPTSCMVVLQVRAMDAAAAVHQAGSTQRKTCQGLLHGCVMLLCRGCKTCHVTFVCVHEDGGGGDDGDGHDLGFEL